MHTSTVLCVYLIPHGADSRIEHIRCASEEYNEDQCGGQYEIKPDETSLEPGQELNPLLYTLAHATRCY